MVTMTGRFLPGVPEPETEVIFVAAAGNEMATGKFECCGRSSGSRSTSAANMQKTRRLTKWATGDGRRVVPPVCASFRPLQLNVSQVSSMFSYEIVTGPVR